jgi:phage host-nuclease inhibitor protein Gam
VNDDSIILYNAFGNQIRQVRTTNKKIIINLAEFSSGIYWLKIGERVEKLIIE